MELLALTLHVVSLLLVVVIPVCALAWSNRRAGSIMAEVLDEQPRAASALLRAFFIGGLLNETAAMFGLIVGLMGVMRGVPSLGGALVYAGAIAALMIPSGIVGIYAAYPYSAALRAIARQPFHAARITNWMVIVLMLLQVAVLLGFMSYFFLQTYSTPMVTVREGLRILIAGLTFGCGAIGPIMGMGVFAARSCTVLGAYPDSYGTVASFAFMSQALIETPIFFVLGMSMFTAYYAGNLLFVLAAAIATVGATLGAGIASGRVASAACEEIGRQPGKSGLFSGSSLLVQTLIDAGVIYGLLVAGFILMRSGS